MATKDKNKDLNCPRGLNERGRKAREAILAVLRKGLLHPKGPAIGDGIQVALAVGIGDVGSITRLDGECPLDREDIFMISLYIDDILDYCYTTVEEMQLLEIEADDYLIDMVKWTREATEELEMAFNTLFTNPRVAGEHARRCKKIENEVEHLYRVAIGDLFTKAKEHIKFRMQGDKYL